MACSLLTIARTMDPAEAQPSVRELFHRHRWLAGQPTPPYSVRDLCARHGDPLTTRHRLLAYNTQLIHGMQFSVCNPIHLGRILPGLPAEVIDAMINEVAPEELVAAFDITAEMLGEAFDIGKQLLAETYPSVIASFTETVTSWIPGLGWAVKTINKGLSDISRTEILGKLSAKQLLDEFEFMTPKDIINKLSLDIGQLAAMFCDRFIKVLSQFTAVPLDVTIDMSGAAPARPARARIAGTMLGDEYDIAALCEVFEPARQSDVIAKAGASGRTVTGHIGPQADGELAGSGLLTITFDGRSSGPSGNPLDELIGVPGIELFGHSSDSALVFSNQGHRLKDADAWSRKGVLHTVVRVDPGEIDLYVTHLYNGGDIHELLNPTDAERWAVKQSQIIEAADFIGDTHEPGRVAILVGDFNVAPSDVAQYDFLRQTMAGRNLVDLWPYWREPGLPTSALGFTNGIENCCVDSKQPYCREPGVPLDPNGQPVGGRRIDYIFVERPLPTHRFTLDFSSVRRRAFHYSGLPTDYLSDHLGLDVTLIASPR